MKIVVNYEETKMVLSYDIIGLSSADMHEMSQLFKRVMQIRVNHITSDKKEYISDDDLMRIEAVLDVLTEGHRVELKKSSFEERIESIKRSNEALSKLKKESDKEVLIKGGPGSWPEAPIAGESKNF